MAVFWPMPEWTASVLHGPGFWNGINEENLSFLIHELGHYYQGDHLSNDYFEALTDLGARLALAVATEPSLVQ